MSLQPDSVGIYLHEISKYPMLTPEQEIIFARQVQQMIAVQQHQQQRQEQLNRQLTLTELATDMGKSETEVSQILRLGQKAKEKMIAANLRLNSSDCQKVSVESTRISRFSTRGVNWVAKSC
ncbi:sigma-70 factor domain-containing protein [Nostoc parmelioides]|uniref:sigma-70 factor domain-containing protein n=1 Tax=Nostoc parmelioides TaxID=1521621 RepID=UPI0030D5666D